MRGKDLIERGARGAGEPNPLASSGVPDRGSGEATDVVLRINDLRKSFGPVEVLKGIDLTVTRSEALAIIGPSGCGKSTLLRCLNGLEPVSGGTILFDGVNVAERGTDLTLLRRRIGMVFQQFALFPHMTCLDNLTIAPRRILRRPKKEVEEEARALLARVGVGHKERAYPRELSGGQQQRVAIARALMMHPVVMLFDEVTSSLDPEVVGEVLDVMRDLAASGMTMLVVTHEMSFAAEVAQELIFMDDGIVVESGDPAVVLSDPRHDRTRQFLSRVRAAW